MNFYKYLTKEQMEYLRKNIHRGDDDEITDFYVIDEDEVTITDVNQLCKLFEKIDINIILSIHKNLGND